MTRAAPAAAARTVTVPVTQTVTVIAGDSDFSGPPPPRSARRRRRDSCHEPDDSDTVTVIPSRPAGKCDSHAGPRPAAGNELGVGPGVGDPRAYQCQTVTVTVTGTVTIRRRVRLVTLRLAESGVRIRLAAMAPWAVTVPGGVTRSHVVTVTVTARVAAAAW